MERLWAPWRMQYVENADQKGCFLCQKLKEGQDQRNCVLWRGAKTFIIMNIFPYNTGHLLLAPFRHIGSLEGLKNDELLELMNSAQMSIRTLKKVFKPQGFNLGLNLGRVAGAGLQGHVHLHLVPRWKGDTNFMPIIGETKVVSEEIPKTCARIRKALDGILKASRPSAGGEKKKRRDNS